MTDHAATLDPVENDGTRTASATLREETALHHVRAEKSEFQRRFVGGRLPLSSYTAWLEQMHHVYGRLEQRLEEHAANPKVSPFLTGPWRRIPDLERDLAHFGLAAGALPPSPAVVAFLAQLDRWASTAPLALLGVLYVLEGSTNGARFIARNVKRAYNLSDGRGSSTLDPYGDAQPERWRAFKTTLDTTIDAAAIPVLVAAAQATFDAVTAIGQDLLAASGPAAETA